MFKSVIALAALAASAAAHCKPPSPNHPSIQTRHSPLLTDTFPSLVVGGTTTPAWVNVRMTNNFDSQAPVTDVTSPDLRCYDSQEPGTATTIDVGAGQQMGIMSDGTIYHPGVVNVYMAKAPGDVDSFAGDGDVWFKVYEISAVTNGGQSITFPAEGVPGVTFTLPKNLPSGQYLVRMEAIALHVASTYGGAQFYVCRVTPRV